MKRTPIKRKLLSRLEEVINWLYKDQPLLTNLTTSVIAIFFLVIVKLALIGFQQKLYSGYFEYIVIALLMSILVLQTSFRVSGWGNISLFFVGIAGVGLFFYNTTLLLPLAGQMIGIFAGGHFIYIILMWIVNNHRRTCELLLHKFFRKRKKSLICVKEENQK